MENKKRKGVVRSFFEMIFKFRGIFLCLPIAVIAVFMGINSYHVLPELVGLFVQANGQFQYFITREVAIFGPALITFLCLLITCFSKKVIYPWLISLFSLVLPVILWFTNTF